MLLIRHATIKNRDLSERILLKQNENCGKEHLKDILDKSFYYIYK